MTLASRMAEHLRRDEAPMIFSGISQAMFDDWEAINLFIQKWHFWVHIDSEGGTRARFVLACNQRTWECALPHVTAILDCISFHDRMSDFSTFQSGSGNNLRLKMNAVNCVPYPWRSFAGSIWIAYLRPHEVMARHGGLNSMVDWLACVSVMFNLGGCWHRFLAILVPRSQQW